MGHNDDLYPSIAELKAERTLNRGERIPLVLIVDTSDSMNNGGRISQVNEGLQRMEALFQDEPLIGASVHMTIISCGPDVNLVTPGWVDGNQFRAPTLTATGKTPMGKAINFGMQILQEQKDVLDAAKIPRVRAWFWMMTDGYPTDEEVFYEAATECRYAMEQRKLIAVPLCLDHAGAQKMAATTTRKTSIYSPDFNFGELIIIASRSKPIPETSQADDDADLAANEAIEQIVEESGGTEVDHDNPAYKAWMKSQLDEF